MYKIDYLDLAKKKLRNLEKLQTDPKLLKATNIHYANNCIDFINDWFMTYDPRKKVPTIPFVLFEKQEELLNWYDSCLEDEEDGILEKSRDMGATYTFCAWSIHKWIYNPGFNVGIGSRKEELVDSAKDPDSIFEKIRAMIRFLPNIFLPDGFDERFHMPFRKIINPENGSIIRGEAGSNMGRGGRSSIYFIDESAFLERPMVVDAALSQNTNCRIHVSTPNGSDNPFSKKRHDGKHRVFSFHWKDDPRKDDVWYEKQKRILDPLVLAQEVDLNYDVHSEKTLIPKRLIMPAVGIDIPEIGRRMGGFDVADEGADKNALTDGIGNKILRCGDWDDVDAGTAAKSVLIKCKDRGIIYVKYDPIGIGAGAKEVFNNIVWSEGQTKIIFVGVNMGEGVNKAEEDRVSEGIKNEDMFKNLKAESWWRVRRRFEKTYEYVVKGDKSIDPSELISIPNDHELITELSSVRYKSNNSGLIIVESKEDMRKRGIKSPNRADSLILYFAVKHIKTAQYSFI